jgi:hypothetical protein
MGSQPKYWKTENGETSLSMLPYTPDIAGRSNMAKTANIRAGSWAQLARRAANPAPSAGPKTNPDAAIPEAQKRLS